MHRNYMLHFLNKWKDLVSLLLSVLTALLFIITAFFTYFQFFKGRTFTEHMYITAGCRVIESDSDSNLHSLVVRFHNIGSVSAMITSAEVDAVFKMKNGTESIHNYIAHVKVADESNLDSVIIIDTQEQDSRTFNLMVPKNVWVVTYKIRTRTKNNAYLKALSIPNKEYETKKEE